MSAFLTQLGEDRLGQGGALARAALRLAIGRSRGALRGACQRFQPVALDGGAANRRFALRSEREGECLCSDSGGRALDVASSPALRRASRGA